jgi:hypothetical protein
MFKGITMPSKKRHYKLSRYVADYQLSTQPAQRHNQKHGHLNGIAKMRCYICSYDLLLFFFSSYRPKICLHQRVSPSFHWSFSRNVVRGLACSNNPEGYAGRSVKLLVGSPKPDRPKVMGQIKRDTPALQR